MQVLFVHSVHTRVCQKELLQCSIAALTATEHHRQKNKSVAFYVVSLKFQVFRGGVAGNFWGGYILVAFQDFTKKAPISL